jgi:dipeptidyl aminopeptidase/acylaminoacyl peptidase
MGGESRRASERSRRAYGRNSELPLPVVGMLAALLLGACGGQDAVRPADRDVSGDVIVLGTYDESALEVDWCSGTLWKIRLGHGPPQHLGRGGCPAWSPDGRHLAASNHGIVVISADGTDRRRLTDGWDLAPAWSPTGERIAFARCVCPRSHDSFTEIWVVDADGGNLRRLARTPSGYDGSALESESVPVQWAPDGRQVFFRDCVAVPGDPGPGSRTFTRAECALASVPLAGGEPTRLTPVGDVWRFSVAPTGPFLAYKGEALFVTRRDGTRVHRLPDLDLDHSPWSPSGLTLPAVAYADPSLERSRWELVEMPSGERRAITDYSLEGVNLGAWSPDGRRLAFITPAGLVVENLPTGATVTVKIADLSSVAWRPETGPK